MALLVYEVLTQLIIWLGLLRSRICHRNLTMQRKHQRTFFASNCENAECCDCGLVHVHYPLFGEDLRERHFRMVPLRPKDYRYRARMGCLPASSSVDLSGVDPWTGK